MHQGPPSDWNFVYMDASFNSSPWQRWYPASTTSKQFCKSHFVAEIWISASVPFWGQNSLVCGGVFAEVGQQNNDPLSSNWNDSVFSHRLILNYPRFSALIKMIKTAHIIFCAILLIFFRLIAANWLLTFITMHGTFIPSVLAWTVDHFILCYFLSLILYQSKWGIRLKT